MAILSYLNIIISVYKSPTLNVYRYDKRIKNHENFKVSMGFGLHIGWAIEGAIGSKHKIDASYLSPNVNLASRLEACTR